MELSGVVSRRIPYFSGAGVDSHLSNQSFSGASVSSRARPIGELRLLGNRNSGVCFRFKRPAMDFGFSDNAHIQYYYAGPRCGEKNNKEKEKYNKVLGAVSTKKKLKLLREFSNNLLGLDLQEGLAAEIGNKLTPEASEVLLKQLQQLREEEKEMKRRRKQEKAQQKAERMQSKVHCEQSSESSSSSSSSSESSDSECGEVIDMNRLRTEACSQPKADDLQPLSQQVATLPLPSLASACEKNALLPHSQQVATLEQHGVCWGKTSTSFGPGSTGLVDESSIVKGASAKRIEVCLGNKCKKSGSAALLEEFQRVMGVEGAVVGCKCMGKCRDGPNVRVLNTQTQVGVDDSVKTVANPLCIGVGLEDVDGIVASLCGEEGIQERKHLNLAVV